MVVLVFVVVFGRVVVVVVVGVAPGLNEPFAPGFRVTLALFGRTQKLIFPDSIAFSVSYSWPVSPSARIDWASASRWRTSFCFVRIVIAEMRFSWNAVATLAGMSTFLMTNVGSPHWLARLERRRAEERLPHRVLEPLGELRLHPVLHLHEEVGAAEELAHVDAPGLLLQRVLDLLPERVLDQVVPSGGRVGLVAEPELLVELAEPVGVELEVHGDLVRDLDAVLGRSDDRVRLLRRADADLLRDDVVHLVGGVQVERVEEPVEEEARTGLDDALVVRRPRIGPPP